MGSNNIWLRRLSQGIFLVVWIFLFWQTAHQDVGFLPPDLFVTTDPLAAAIIMVASRVWVSAMWGGVVLIILTLLLGRFFCGWVCPLGTIFDIVGSLWKGKKSGNLRNDLAWRRVKYYLLIAIAISALFGGQLLYWGDPLVVLFRGTAMGPLTPASSQTAFLPFFLLLTIIGLCGITHRFWCRYLCPLGAFYGVLARFSVFRKRRVGCDKCKGLDGRNCQYTCSMGTDPSSKQGSPEECIRCMACQAACEKGAITFVATRPVPVSKENVMDLERRTFVASVSAGVVTGVAAFRANAMTDESWRVVRPPHVVDEDAFTAMCVRCGQCVRSCPTGTLQPLLLEAGFAGLWTPAVTPRVGGCKADCNACSGACPTGAIPIFGPKREEKWVVKMGLASFQSDHCITYADDAVKPCLKCVEACPNKAIVVDMEAKPERPIKINRNRCVGCGLCESACRKMVPGRPAMNLTSKEVGIPTQLVVNPTPILPVHHNDNE